MQQPPPQKKKSRGQGVVAVLGRLFAQHDSDGLKGFALVMSLLAISGIFSPLRSGKPRTHVIPEVRVVKGSALPLGNINCWTGVPGTNENCSMIVKSHSGL